MEIVIFFNSWYDYANKMNIWDTNVLKPPIMSLLLCAYKLQNFPCPQIMAFW